jgi:hypothetical protein
MLHTDSKLKRGVVWYLGGALFVAVLPELVASGSTLELLLLCSGYTASLYGMVISFIGLVYSPVMALACAKQKDARPNGV